MSRYSRDSEFEQSSIDFTYQVFNKSLDAATHEASTGLLADRQPEALSVTAALAITKKHLETLHLTILGEVSEVSDKLGYKAVYFTISDKSSALPCLIWRNVYERQGTTLARGMLVQISGRFSLYAAKGRMNFEVSSITLAGEGNLRLKVAQLAKKLEAQGLMDPERKLPLPQLPQRVAVVTSPRGKAVHDVIRTLRRRFPLATLLLFGVAVEGQNAAVEIAQGLAAAQNSEANVILLVRGGGSYEDLMPFNDEKLAIQIANSKTPIITGIGHEPDNSIADMVASFRASTPTAAAEQAVPDVSEVYAQLQTQHSALSRSLNNQIVNKQLWLNGVLHRPLFANKQSLTSANVQSLEQAEIRLQTAIPNAIAQSRAKIDLAKKRLPAIDAIYKHRVRVTGYSQDITRSGKALLSSYQSQLANAAGKLESLSPLAVLKRGYAATYNADGQIVSSISGILPDDKLDVRVQDGIINCVAVATRQEEL